MRTKLAKIALTAALTLAAALTFSCSGDDGGNDNNPAVSSSSKNAGVSSSSGLENNSSSSSHITNSSSSEQAGKVCVPLNNYIMAVEMNLNGEPVVVRKNGEVLVEGVNYEVIETQNSVKVQGLLDYIGSVERGSVPANALEFVVRDGEKVLAEGTDYEVINTGSFIKFVGINAYAGSVKIELPCEPEQPVTPEPSGLGYFGNVGTLGVIDLMADPNHAVWSSTSYNMDLPNYNTTSGVGFKSFEVAKPGNTPITFTKAGYTFIALPAELGYPSRINNALGLDVKEVYNSSEKIIKGNNYIVYESDNESVNIGHAVTETIIY